MKTTYPGVTYVGLELRPCTGCLCTTPLPQDAYNLLLGILGWGQLGSGCPALVKTSVKEGLFRCSLGGSTVTCGVAGGD